MALILAGRFTGYCAIAGKIYAGIVVGEIEVTDSGIIKKFMVESWILSNLLFEKHTVLLMQLILRLAFADICATIFFQTVVADQFDHGTK